MGNQISHPNSTSVDALASEVPDFVQQNSSARFMKSIRGKSFSEQPMILKVFVKPNLDVNVSSYLLKAKAEAAKMNGSPHLCPYARIFETEKAVYLLRPYFHSNLYDRISTRPFLESIERKWIAFQLLSAVASLHHLNLRHGDIKIENVMITSWNAVYLVDFASFKPTTLPVDNPTDFFYFFDSSSRRTCYLAPERFNEHSFLDVTESMDIFSLGCVIAELFLEGTPLFHLSQLLKYQKKEYDPVPALNAIDDEIVIEMIKKMIHLDPLQRPSSQELLDTYRNLLFPDAFYSSLSTFVHHFATPFLPDQFCPGDLPFTRSDLRILLLSSLPPLPIHLSLILLNFITSCVPNLIYPFTAIQAIQLLLSLYPHVSDSQRLDRILPYLCYFLQSNLNTAVKVEALKSITTLLSVQSISIQDIGIFTEILFPLFSKNVLYGEEFLRATFAQCLADLADVSTKFVDMGHSIFQRGEATSDVDPLFSIQNFDVFLADMRDTFLEYLRILISDESIFVRKAFLAQVTRLCIFFGRQTANDTILSHIITYLNDKDPSLRSAFFETLAGVGTVAGENSLQEYVLPVLLQSLQDPHAMVVDRALNALSALVELELFKKSHLRSILSHCSPFMLHPNVFLRYSSVAVVCACSRVLSPIDVACLLAPSITPFVVLPPPYQSFTPALLLRILKSPVLHETLEVLKDPELQQQIPQKEYEKLDLLQPILPTTSLISMPTVYDQRISIRILDFMLRTLFLTPPPFHASISKPDQQMKSANETSPANPTSIHSKSRASVFHRFSAPSLVSHDTSTRSTNLFFNSSELNLHTVKHKYDYQSEPWSTSITLEPWQSQYEGKNSYLRKLLMTRTQDLILNTHVFNYAIPALQTWQPQGTLMVHLTEHQAPVHQLCLSFDQSWLFSNSLDHTVKIWNLQKLYKNFSTKSTFTYTMASDVTCLTCMSHGYFACGSAQGTIHMIELQRKRLQLVREWVLEKNEIPRFLRFYQTDIEAVLMVVTSHSMIYGYNLNERVFQLTCPLAYGVISSVLIDDRHQHWLLLGTARGLLLLYDLRLRLLILKWMHPSRSQIHQLCSHPTLTDHVLIATGKNEVSIWNLVQPQCTHILCRQLPAPPYEPMTIPQPKDFIQNALRVFDHTPSWEGYYAMYAPKGSPYVILAGTDRKVRFWYFNENKVLLVCGHDEEEGDLVFTHQEMNGISILVESTTPTFKKPKGIIGFTLKETNQLVNHQDTIMDVQVLHQPFPILLTCSRDSTIKLWK